MTRVIILVGGGIATVVEKPAGVEVWIVDHDEDVDRGDEEVVTLESAEVVLEASEGIQVAIERGPGKR